MSQKITLKATLSVPALAEAAAIARRSLAERTTLPVTNYFLVKFNGDCQIISTDLEVMTKVIVKPCGTEVDGSFVVPGKIFAEVLDELNVKTLTKVKDKRSKRIPIKRMQFIRYDNQATMITCDPYGFSFEPNYTEEDFVPCPEVQGDQVNILDMAAMLKNLMKHCPNEKTEYRSNFYGVEFDLENNKAVACDNTTMGIAKLYRDGACQRKFRICSKAVEILAKLDGICRVTLSEERVRLVIGNVEIVTRNLDVDKPFIDYVKLDGDEKNKAKIKHYS